MSVTLNDFCEFCNNWFDTKEDGTKNRIFGEFTIENGFLDLSETDIKQGQHFRIIGSVFNDGIYQYPNDGLSDEVFEGAIWIMRIPPNVFALIDKINEWNEKYEAIVESPFISEEFGGYSYSKDIRNGRTNISINWQSQFAQQLRRYMKVRNI